MSDNELRRLVDALETALGDLRDGLGRAYPRGRIVTWLTSHRTVARGVVMGDPYIDGTEVRLPVENTKTGSTVSVGAKRVLAAQEVLSNA